MNKKVTKAGLNPDDFTGIVDGKNVKMFILENNNGTEVSIINYGAKIVSICVPDRENHFTDVVLGHKNLSDYINSEEAYFGAVCGRTANRIANGRFKIDDIEYILAQNNGPNSLHGGIKGFNAVAWDAEQTDRGTLILKYISKDGEEGFPGNLCVQVTYLLKQDNTLSIQYEASTDKKTILNLTNHSYFNLSGAGNQSVCGHLVTIAASSYLPTDETAIPLGKAVSVKNTPFDFLKPHTIGERIEEKDQQLIIGHGYDHNYVLDKETEAFDFAAECYSPQTGINMVVRTSEPGLQLYTGNWMSGNFEGKLGKHYPARSAVCFETQHYPDSINHPDYPSILLEPGRTFKSKTEYQFSVK